MTLHLHLGAHKTATTYIQSRIQQEAQLLKAEGVSYVPVASFRPWRRQTLSRAAKKGHGASRTYFSRFFKRWCPRGCSTLLISDENMIGTCGNIVRFGRLYPELTSKLGGVAEMVGDHPVSIYVSIRCYDAFYAAVYCEALRYDTHCTFTNFAARLDPTARRWQHILADIAILFPESPISVWPYETFRHRELEIFDRLVGKSVASRMTLTGDIMRGSMSPKAVEIIETLGQRVGWFLASRMVPMVEFLVPREDESPSFAPWTEHEKHFLRRLYEEDLAIISANQRYEFVGCGSVGWSARTCT
jgi:hypothetical protein